METLRKYIKGDIAIWAVAFGLALFSILEVYSTTGILAYKHKGGNTEHYLLERLAFIIASFVLMYFVHKVKYTYFLKISRLAVLVVIPLLVITLAFGSKVNEASRWLTIPGLPVSFQTSDLAKLALITFIAGFLAKNQDKVEDYRKVLLPIMVITGLVCLLILPANFSTAAMLFFICFLLLFIGRIPMKQLGAIVLAGVVFLTILIGVIYKFPKAIPRGETWKKRVENYASGSEKENYQAELAKMAIAAGGFTGTGLANNPHRYFLPQSSSDFIYAMISGEFGFLGASILLLLYLILLYRAVRIAKNSEYSFAVLLSIGLSLLIVMQAVINMAVGVTLFPVTGQPLPFVSMGGTGTLFTGIALGMLLSVSRSVYDKEEVQPQIVNTEEENEA